MGHLADSKIITEMGKVAQYSAHAGVVLHKSAEGASSVNACGFIYNQKKNSKISRLIFKKSHEHNIKSE